MMWAYKAMALCKLGRQDEAHVAIQEAVRKQIESGDAGKFFDLNIHRAKAMLGVSLPGSP